MIYEKLCGQRVAEVNLDVWSRALAAAGKPPKKGAAPGEAEVAAAHAALGLAWSHGGWMEDRSHLWRGIPYLKKAGTFLHLGRDYNAPAGTVVSVDVPCRVLHVGDDHPALGGWGPHAIVEIVGEPMALIYAHLDPLVFTHRVGADLDPGKPLSVVGKPEHNGGWYAHTHVQAMPIDLAKRFLQDPEAFDGYGKVGDIEKLVKAHPDPARWVLVE